MTLTAIRFPQGIVASQDDARESDFNLSKNSSVYTNNVQSAIFNQGSNFGSIVTDINEITISDGYGVAYGRAFKLTTAQPITITGGTGSRQYGYVVVRIDMAQTPENMCTLMFLAGATAYPTLRKDDVLNTSGIYDFEICKFEFDNTGIYNLVDLAIAKLLNYSNIEETKLDKTAKAADSNLLDGLDSTAFLRSTGKAADSEKLDNLSSGSFMRSDADTGTSGSLYNGSWAAFANDAGSLNSFKVDSTGYPSFLCDAENAAYYMKKATWQNDSRPVRYSTLRLGDVVVHKSDALPAPGNFIYRQIPTVNFGVESRPNEEGEECFFLLDILESMQSKINTLENEVAILKGQ